MNLKVQNPLKACASIGTQLLSHVMPLIHGDRVANALGCNAKHLIIITVLIIIKRAIRTKITTCGSAEETEKGWGKKVTKPLYFNTMWWRHFATDLHKIW